DMVSMLTAWRDNGTLVNPYFLELLSIQQQTPAYLYPSQDSWNFVGTTGTLGMQPQPLNGQAAWGDGATLDWYLGNAVAVPEPAALGLLAVAGLTLVAIDRRRRGR
ncbi:MAG: PEP-CTERM sorting domain-containing protein, partial [Planctomycetota bacterium]